MKIFKKSVWALLTAYLAIWLCIAVFGGIVMNGYKNTINETLGLTGYRSETVDTGVYQDTEYFKSDYVKKNADGTVATVTDKNGYTHQIYDDESLWAAELEATNRVQREGATILWNRGGLPLATGNRVSLFSRSSVDYVTSGTGSGLAYPSTPAPSYQVHNVTMKSALEDAGLAVNDKLWEFYLNGAGKSYVRSSLSGINEVPWSKYTSTELNSFSDFSDAAIVVISRRGGEGENDLSLTNADTPSGDYLDFSRQEIAMLEKVTELRRNRTFGKLIVLLNTATGVNFSQFANFEKDIDCCIWVGQSGSEALAEVGNILVGKSTPSGHLTDTFAYDNKSAPSVENSVYATYSDMSKLKHKAFQGTYLVYAEGIYVGYKYYETRYEDAVLGNGGASGAAGAKMANEWVYSKEVAYPFGYGAAYTDFSYSGFSVEKNKSGDYDVKVTVTNVGKAAGADAVQIYSQRPYTDYDKQHGLEQSAVNLCGYAKTDMIEPDRNETVNITVPAETFATYDFDGQKTYIFEKGAYYLTAAEDAHHAVNNILAAKGKTPANTNGVMDGEGNTALVWSFENKKNDYGIFSESANGTKIMNRLDDADWNTYANKGGETVTYLSRKDWQGTYPQKIKLSLTDGMVKDLDWNKSYTSASAKMPKYGQPHTFNLIDLKGYAYDHEAWGTLLDQLTLDEQIEMLGKAYHGTPAILSIVKPKETTSDAPNGVHSGGQSMHFPCAGLLAASFNDELAEQVGEFIGEDMLHTHTSGLYAPAANIHRNAYGARAYEYYSEDGFLSGIMAMRQVKGIQSKGGYVNMKHLVGNDQETNRYGIGIWANEQTFREIYLEAFRPAVEQAQAKGMMSSFSRMGTIWSGAHSGLNNDILRGEWGFDGFVISDCAWREYMGVVDGLVGGNDCILYEGTDLAAYYEAKNNPYIAQLIRESSHRILYVVVNGNSMNGYSTNTKLYEVTNWWQRLITAMQAVFGVLTGACAVMLVLCFVFAKRRCALYSAADGEIVSDTPDAQSEESDKFDGQDRENEHENEHESERETDAETPNAKSAKRPINKKKAAIFSGAGAACVALILAIVLPITLTGKPNNGGGTGTNGGDEPPAPATTVYKFEAECAELETTIARCEKGLEGTVTACNNPSGGMFIHHLSDGGDATITFEIASDKDAKAKLALGLGNQPFGITELFELYVNGKQVALDESVVYATGGDKMYFQWTAYEVAQIDLVGGNNVIILEKVRNSSKANGLNFDYMTLDTDAALGWKSEQGVGHTYGEWSLVSAPSLTVEGVIASYCTTCRDLKEATLPVISEENGWVKSNVSGGTESFGKCTWTYDYEGTPFSFVGTSYPEGSLNSYKFECERMTLSGNIHISSEVDANDPSGGAYVGGWHCAHASVTLTIESDEETDALFFIGFGARSTADIRFNIGHMLTVNDSAVTVGDEVVFYAVDGPDWFVWTEYEVAVIHLKKGKNTIVLSNNGADSSNLDYFKLTTKANLDIYEEI